MRTILTITLILAIQPALGCGKGNGKADGKTDTGTNAQKDGKSPVKVEGDDLEPLAKQQWPVEFTGTKPNGKHDGGFRQCEFFLVLDKDGATPISLNATVKTESLFSDNEKLTAHLMSNDFFDVKKHAEIKFVSKSIKAEASGSYTHVISGDLTMLGMTNEVTIPSKITVSGKSYTVLSQFTINRQDYGMTYGGGKIDDNVKIRANLTQK